MLAAAPLVRSMLSRNAASLSRAYHAGGNHRSASMNDLPVPEGDWQESYQAKQVKRNGVLAASFLFFVGALTFVNKSGIIDFNFFAPKTYE